MDFQMQFNGKPGSEQLCTYKLNKYEYQFDFYLGTKHAL